MYGARERSAAVQALILSAHNHLCLPLQDAERSQYQYLVIHSSYTHGAVAVYGMTI